MSLKVKLNLLFIVPLLIQLLILFEIQDLSHAADASLQRESKAHQISALSNQLQKQLASVFTNIVLYKQTTFEVFKNKFQSDLSSAKPINAALISCLSQAGYDGNKLTQVQRNFERAAGAANMFLDNDPTAGEGSSRKAFTHSIAVFVGGLTKQSQEIDAFAHDLNPNPGETIETRNRLNIFLAVACCIDVLIATILVVVVTQKLTKRVEILTNNTIRLAAGLPLLSGVAGDDELTQLDLSFKKMARELSDSLRRQTALVDNASHLLCSLTPQLSILEINNACRSILGYEPGQLIGKKLSKLMADSKNVQDFVLAKELSQISSFDAVFRRLDSTDISLKWSVVWSASDENYFCVARDISQEKELARLKQELLDTVTHDLKSPLTAIVANLSNVRMKIYGDFNDVIYARIDRAELEAKRLVTLVSDLLDQERLSSGKMQFMFASIAASEIIQNSAETLRDLAEAKRISLNIHLPVPDLYVLGDKMRIEQVLVNLLSNAITHTPANSSVSLRAWISADFVIFEVEDEGQGVPAEKIPSIFGRFNQLPQTQGGSGLGLHISKRIIEAHGGNIGVKTNSQGGSTFWFSLKAAG